MVTITVAVRAVVTVLTTVPRITEPAVVRLLGLEVTLPLVSSFLNFLLGVLLSVTPHSG